MFAALVLGGCAALAVSFVVDAYALPLEAPCRSRRGAALHAAAVTFLYGCLLLASGRIAFSAVVAIALVGVTVALNNAKYESLQEPLVFTDLSLFSQLFAHPRLYLPFLSASKALGIALAVAAVGAGYLADIALDPRPAGVALAAIGVSLVAAIAVARAMPLGLEPSADRRAHGFFSVFVAYLLNGLRPATWRALERAMGNGPHACGHSRQAPASRPDIIVVQSESFFDARRLGDAIYPTILARFADATADSVSFGELDVPAWGANTMRSEFAMLTGLSRKSLGYARFYPYAFVRRACAALPRRLREVGYRTLAIHPYHADFFGRKRVFPLMGFDRFIDIGAFARAERAGSYVSDAALADAIIDALDAPRDEPLFVFAMTMENHGPLHLEQVGPGESAAFHALGEDPAWRDLTAYLRHVVNADAMLDRLIRHLRARRRDTVLCLYGDHVPALPHVFAKLGVTPTSSDYLIWRNFGERPAKRRAMRVEDLSSAVLRAIDTRGLESGAARATRQATVEE